MENRIYKFKRNNDKVYQPKALKPPSMVYHISVGMLTLASLMAAMYLLSILVFAIMGVDQ